MKISKVVLIIILASTFLKLEVAASGFDCLTLEANINEPCDDGDPATLGEIITEDCTCEVVNPPINAQCDGAISITEGDYSCPGPYGGGGSVLSELLIWDDYDYGANACWYTLEVTQQTMVGIVTSPEYFLTSNPPENIEPPRTNISIIKGSECGNFVLLELSDYFIDFPAEPGETYYIVFDDTESSRAFDFQVELLEDATRQITELILKKIS